MSTSDTPSRPRTATVLSAMAVAAALTLPASVAAHAETGTDAVTDIVTVDFAESTGAVHGGATGMLYGLSDPGVPSRAVVAGAHPHTVTQMPEGGAQHPNGGALTVSDTFFDAGGEDIYINIQDQYPKWGYATAEDPPNTYPGQADYLSKVRTVVERVQTEADPEDLDRYVFTPFNEPDWIWYGDWQQHKQRFFDDWVAAYRLIHDILPEARIAGPGESQYHPNRATDFLTFAAENNVLPDIYTWHELDTSDLADYRGHYQHFRKLEESLGLQPMPINVTEYALPRDTGAPGRMIQWISMFEDTKVDAQVAYWSFAGNLNDHAVQTNGGNGGWWLMKWYADLTGRTVSFTPPQPNTPNTLQGIGAIDTDKELATVLLGGGTKDVSLNMEGLDSSIFGDAVDIRVARTGFTGQEGFSTAPATIKAERVQLDGGQVNITIDNSDVMDAYRVLITPASGPAPEATAAWSTSIEAEDTELSGAAQAYDKSGGWQATSSDGDVGNMGGSKAALDWTVEVPRDGTYTLGILYGTGDKISPEDRSIKSGRHALYIDGELDQIVQYDSTLSYVYKGRVDVPVKLTAGTHTFSLRTSADGGATSLPGSNMALDRFDLTEKKGPETATYPALLARTTGDVSLRPNDRTAMSSVALGAGAAAEFFLSASDNGYYDVTVDYRTEGAVQLPVSLNGRTLEGLGAEKAGTWSSTATVHLAKGIQQLRIDGAEGLVIEAVHVTRNSEADANIATIEAEDASVTRSEGVTLETPAEAYGSNVSGQFAGWLTAGRTLSIERPEGMGPGQYNFLVRYANADKFTGHPYNTDVITRTAEVAEAGTDNVTVGQFRHNYSYYSFWWQNVPIELATNDAPITFGNPSGNAPNVDAFQLAPLVAGLENEASEAAPAFVPLPADKKELKKDTEMDLGLDKEKFGRGASTVELQNLEAGTWVYVYLNETGLGWHRVDAGGSVEVTTPEQTRPGNNKVVVFDDDGALLGWERLHVVGGPRPAS